MSFAENKWTKVYFVIIGLLGTALNLGIFVVLLSCKNKMGGYRSLIGVYVLSSLAYSMYNIIVRPIILINEDGWLMYGSGLEMDQTLGSMLTGIFCSMASILVASISFSYIFRYVTVCRIEGMLYIYQHCVISIVILLTVGAIASVAGTGLLYLLPDQETNDAFKEVFFREFGRPIEISSYFGCLTYRNGYINPIFIISFGCRAGLCAFSTGVMCICGVKIVNHLRSQVENMSSDAPFIGKQKRLFSLLVVQSSVPVIMFYLPLGAGFILATLKINCPIVCRIMSLLMPISAVVDPILIFLNVSQYRRFIYYKCGCQKRDIYRMKRSYELQSLAKGSNP